MEDLTPEEFDWFQLLTDDEKIIFIYNKIFNQNVILEEPSSSLVVSYQDIQVTDINDLYTVILSRILNTDDFIINFYNGVIIIGSGDYMIIRKMKKRLISDGFIFNCIRTDINENTDFKYLEILELVNTTDPISLS